MAMLRVVVVAEDVPAGNDLAAVIAEEADAVVVDQFGADEAADADLAAVDVAIWDLGEDRTRIAAQLAVIGRLGVPTLVLGPDDAAAEAMAAGAKGFLPRTGTAERVAAAARAAAADLLVLDPAFTIAVLPVRDRDTEAIVEDLTRRELDVLQLLAEGLSNKEIAERLGITDHTVKFHVTTILSKLDAHSRTEAVTKAARLGLIIL
jgi:DNA-binding NarL/FixJ family response regulator